MGTLENKKNRKYIWLSAIAAAALSPVHSALAGATTCVQSAISITVLIATPTLDFATIMVCSGTGGTVTVSETNGARSATGCNNGVQGTVSRAKVRIKGNQAGNGVSIKVTITNANSAIVATSGAGTKTMSVTGVKMKQGAPTYSFAGAATKTVDIGGTLNHGANQTGGTYNGTFTLNAVCI